MVSRKESSLAVFRDGQCAVDWIEEIPDSKSIMSESRVCKLGNWCDPPKTWWTRLKKSSRFSCHRSTERLRLFQEVIDVVRTRCSNICKHHTSNTANSYVKWIWRKQMLRWKQREQVCDELQHHHKQQQLERHAQQAAHNAQQVHQWRCWLRRLRGALRALSLHKERTVPHLMMATAHLMAQVLNNHIVISMSSMARSL